VSEDISIAQKLLQCSSGTELYGIYANYWQTLASQCHEEFAKLAALWRNVADERADRAIEPSSPIEAGLALRHESGCCGTACTSPCREQAGLPEVARSQHH
jgi:hypothetical protein